MSSYGSFDTSASSATPPPSTVRASYWLYIAGAVLGIIGAIVLVAVLPGQLAAAQSQVNSQLQGRSTNGVDVSGVVTGAAIAGIVFSCVLTIAFSVLTIVFSRKMLQGRNWARIVLAVFAGLQIFGAFNVTGTFGVSTLHFLVVLAALILSFLSASNAWFREQKAAVGPTV